MRRGLDYIDRHLDGDLDLETVSGVAAFSKFHFHRQFTATFGLSVHRYVQLARMKRASHRLRLSATVRAITFVVPKISRLGAVACGLRASPGRNRILETQAC
jgi:AraC-like DNA-binding protein